MAASGALTQPRGYTKLSNFMVGENHVMLRQYKELAVRDLLYLQAEICDLQYDHTEKATADANALDSRNEYDRDWLLLESQEHDDDQNTQWALAQKIREKLREYCKHAFRYRTLWYP